MNNLKFIPRKCLPAELRINMTTNHQHFKKNTTNDIFFVHGNPRYTRILLKTWPEIYCHQNLPLTCFLMKKISMKTGTLAKQSINYFLHLKIWHTFKQSDTKLSIRQKDLVPKDCLMKLVEDATFATTPQWRPSFPTPSIPWQRQPPLDGGIKGIYRRFDEH